MGRRRKSEEPGDLPRDPLVFFDFRVKGRNCSEALLSYMICFTPVAKGVTMSLRLGICFLMIAAVPEVFGQQDSVLLNPVTIYGLTDSAFLTGSSVESLDVRLKRQQNSRHLGEILSFQFPVYFRNYGNAMISGISMRGTSPQHVAVRWNGININSFSLGQVDFSLLPAVAFDDIKVHQGGGSARFGSGAIGGTILLNSGGNNNDVLSFSQEAGSFDRYFTSLRGNYGIGKLRFTTSFYNIIAENDFPIARSNDRQQNASYAQLGLVQGFHYAFTKKHRISADYWYHQAERQIQPPIGNVNSRDEQDDRSHRLSVRYQIESDRGKTDVTGGFVDDVIVFNGARSEMIRWIASASYQHVLTNGLNLNFTSELNHIIGKVPEYGSNTPSEDRIDVAVSLKKTVGPLTGVLNIRKPFITSLNPPLLPYVGVSVDILRRLDYALVVNANASRNFRAPTFNDRYWADLGRRDLLSETSYGGESGFKMSVKKLFTVSGTGFYQKIDQWIQWVPDGDGVFRPRNIKQVVAKGTEFSVELRLNDREVTYTFKSSYQLTRSVTASSDMPNDPSVGKQIVYTPVHTASTSGNLSYKKWKLDAFAQFSGKRYTESSNSAIYALQPFALVDLSIGRSVDFDRHHFEVSFLTRNVMNKTYTLYSGRAMPGINFNIRFTYQLKNKIS